MSRRGLAVLATLALLTFSGEARAIGNTESEDGEHSLDAAGAVRLTGAYLHFRDLPEPLAQQDDSLAGTVTRLILTGTLGASLSYEANLFMDLSRAPASMISGSFVTAGALDATTRYRTKALGWTYWEEGAVSGKLGIDRLSVKLEAAPILLTAGRFTVNYSVTSIFTPNDFFAPFSATAINTAYKPGVDALRLGLSLGMLSGLEVVRVLGYDDTGDPTWGRSALLGRANTTLWGIEWSLLGGKVAERWIAGASVQGELGPLGIRAEGHAGFADDNGDGSLGRAAGGDDVHGRVAAGLDLPFDWQSLTVAAEYAFYSDGASEPAGYIDRSAHFFPDDAPFLGQHYVGASVRSEIIPILNVAAVTLFNPVDTSGLSACSLLLSVADEADFVGGVMIPWGQSPTAAPPPQIVELNSEYGLYPITAFAETRFYF